MLPGTPGLIVVAAIFLVVMAFHFPGDWFDPGLRRLAQTPAR